MLLEAVLTIVVVSICLSFLVGALATNFRTGVRFQEAVRSLMVMKNRLGLLYVTEASQEDMGQQSLEEPYGQFAVTTTKTKTLNEHLKNVVLKLDWPSGNAQGHLEVTTIVHVSANTPQES